MADEQTARMIVEGAAFDLDAVTTEDWLDHNEAITDMTIDGRTRRDLWVAWFQQVCVKLPSGWGDPKKAETYKKLKQFSQWEPLVDSYWAAVEDTRKKARATYTSA